MDPCIELNYFSCITVLTRRWRSFNKRYTYYKNQYERHNSTVRFALNLRESSEISSISRNIASMYVCSIGSIQSIRGQPKANGNQKCIIAIIIDLFQWESKL